MGLFSRTRPEDAARAQRRAKTERQQTIAADPAASAWVSANAGTGKTHVLTLRVLRLLLAGTAPERILALTYTKAAAAEMSKRVFARLADWVMADDAALERALRELVGRSPTAEERQRARQLFAVAIETPGGLKVQTIHAFCERLLQRFPLEASVPPGFAILDDQERRQLLAEATDEMLSQAIAEKAGPLWASLQTAIAYAVDDRLEAVLAQAFADRGSGLADLSEQRLAKIERDLRRACGVRAAVTGADLTAELAGVFSATIMPALAQALRESTSKRDAEQARHLQSAIAAVSARGRAEALEGFFLTQDRAPRQNLVTKGVSDRRPDLASALLTAQGEFVALYREHKGLILVEATLALLRLAQDVLDRYTRAKARRAALDFDDLVTGAARLLASTQAVEWVLYKLDGGLDHILVDEAQDTSPAQWQVIRALADEFFSGQGANECARTLFAVGDEKQSIYGFQGAAPAMFAKTGNELAARAGQARLPWRRVPLTLSFRAVEPLLAAVDRIFSAPERTPGVTAARSPIVHVADRSGQAGFIEIWPTETFAQAEPCEPWAPLAEESSSPSHVRLAARIAATIDGWLKSGERLESENRPIGPGDILILVRKRAPFAAAMVSALKTRGIRVAGADRLMLTEQIAVQDLVALGDVFMLPSDDLALAAVLKSPLFGLDDDDLLSLAPKRQGTLWQALSARAGTATRFAEVAAKLERWRVCAGELPPFEFYAGLLDGEGMRGRMLARLGPESADPIDEFLNLALAYDDGAPPSLQGFLSWLRDGTREIKRDMEQGLDEVRVMTVHGAKGLEAPIVFLPDTCSTRSGRQPGSLLELDEDGAAPFLWPVKGTSDLTVVQQAKTAVAEAEAHERNRLLYVALTRARDRLYVAGFENSRPPPADCWYNLIRDGLAGQLRDVALPDGRVGWRLASAQTAKPEPSTARAAVAASQAPLPDWASAPAPPEPLIRIPLAPSRLAPLETEGAEKPAKPKRGRPAEPPILPPAALAEDGRFLRGTLTHALLEHLPTLPHEQWHGAADAFVASRAAQLSGDVRRSIVAETLAVLRDPAFAPLFGPTSRAEVPIVADIRDPRGRGPALRLTGKIDRLVQDGTSILIVDYKTNRPPPKNEEQVAEAYLLQLAAYRLAAQQIFAGAHIRAAILWTDGPRIMEISSGVLDAREQQLWQLERANLDA